MAGGAGDVWWSEELGDNLHQIYKLEKAIKREEDKLTTDAQKMDNLVDAVMKEMEEHEAKFRRSRSLRQPMNDGPLDQPFEEMLRETTPPSTETAAASAAIPQTRPVINNINVSATPSLDSAAASAANTTRAQNSSRQNSSRQNSSRATPSSLSNTSSEDPLLSASLSTRSQSTASIPSLDFRDDPLLSATLSNVSRFDINDDPLLSA